MNPLAPINDVLIEMLGPLGPMIAVGGLGLLLVLLTVPFMLNVKKDPLDKLKDATREKRDTDRENQAALRQREKGEKLKRYANFLEPQDAKELSAIKLKLLRAGYRSREAVRIFHFAQMAFGLFGLVLGVAYLLAFGDADNTSPQQLALYVLGPGAAGYLLPKYWVTRRVEERKEEITDGFPDSLDMLLVCVEAGQSLNQAIIRVARELRASFPSLADEYEIVSHEMKAGKDKAQVLTDMGERCGVQDVSSFVTVLIQSQTFGTSISEALRVYAAEMRDKRVMRAEEKANKLPTKMTLTTMMLTVPPLLIILIGPSAIGIAKLGEMSGN
ncbi:MULTISPECIES: type II secretion system F family protein [unclassified Rhodosalinus]|uniref:type II secretion system F family protein n=1 Tax=unclassified Rhodosalinus TaxID=2630183 RepID=UPI0035250C92